MKRLRTLLPLPALAALTACAHQVASGVEPQAPGFLLGLWHGFIFPVAWVLSLFVPDIAIFGSRPKFILSACRAGSRRAVPNNGGWYDFGYFIGIVFLGVGARKSHVVYKTRVIRR